MNCLEENEFVGALPWEATRTIVAELRTNVVVPCESVSFTYTMPLPRERVVKRRSCAGGVGLDEDRPTCMYVECVKVRDPGADRCKSGLLSPSGVVGVVNGDDVFHHARTTSALASPGEWR